MANKDKLLTELGQVSFCINDLTLYLDTHPQDKEALALFAQLQKKRKDALVAFEEANYPLMLDFMDENTEQWTWGDVPAPWEVEANVEL